MPEYSLGKHGKARYLICYYLADGSIEVREDPQDFVERKNCKKFLSRRKLPKTRTGQADHFPSMEANKDFFSPSDFMIGTTINILNKDFFIFDMDPFTKDFYSEFVGHDKLEAIPIHPLPSPSLPLQVPPHSGLKIGTFQDSLQNCLKLTPQPPKLQLKKKLDLAGKKLRFELSLVSPHPRDKYRRFILTYHLEDDSISIFENALPNSGLRDGRFMERKQVYIPGSASIDKRSPEIYTLQNMGIGDIIEVHGRKFLIQGADKAVLKYIQEEDTFLPPGFREKLEEYLSSSTGLERSVEHVRIPVA
ncbi:EF-hand domain-containing protein 1 [Eurytemora carolleeae]|uniref:EF-hand domain-containing protein 1 n=1 Tax=Eurytemora carolleeae TaxID=1294199 RepID=UPI000C794E83|nr:EF-hand domain-containing protein 1 [Eurytemora carolleeae]|eukprot:XP_023344770.1 EF-hand domain-containing protein 1-like [Eurytemora affinis]